MATFFLFIIVINFKFTSYRAIIEVTIHSLKKKDKSH